MDHNFELSNYERHQTHIYSLQDLLVSSEYYAKTHPDAWASRRMRSASAGRWPEEEGPAAGQKALAATPKPAPAAKPVAAPVGHA